MSKNAAQEADAPPQSKVTILSKANAEGPRAVLNDFYDGFLKPEVWQAFAWDEIQNRYRRSWLGMAWIAISFLMFVAGISVVFNAFNSFDSRNFVFFVAIGLASFSFLVANLTDGCVVYTNSATWIKSSALPYSIYIYKNVARAFFPFAIDLSLALLIMLVLGWLPSTQMLLCIPAIVFYVINAVLWQTSLGLIGARWNDFTHLISAFTRFLFFLTPIMWVHNERTGVVKIIADINPLTHFIEILRAPIMNVPINTISWPYVIGFTLFSAVATLTLSALMRRRIPFWI